MLTYTTPGGDLLTSTPTDNTQILSGEIITALLLQLNERVEVVNLVNAPQLTHYDINLLNIADYNENRLKRVIKQLEALTHYQIAFTRSYIAHFGLDIIKANKSPLNLKTGLETASYNTATRSTAALGKDTAGNNVLLDIATAPHLLIGGTTGSGKSVLLNSIIISLLYKATPRTTGFIMIDPKQVEMAAYRRLPMLERPIATTTETAIDTLKWACDEMARRYKYLERHHLKSIENTHLKRLYIIIDELADLMLTSKKQVEQYIVRIAQLGRACGVHLIVATQRPSVNVVTGLIKANIPTKVCLTVASPTDSMTILSHGGGEKLTGRGDAILKRGDSTQETRFQAYYTPETDIEAVNKYIYKQYPFWAR